MSPKTPRPSEATIALAEQIQRDMNTLGQDYSIDAVTGEYLAQALRERIASMHPAEQQAFLAEFFNLAEATEKLGQLAAHTALLEKRRSIEFESNRYEKLSFANVQEGQTVTIWFHNPKNSHVRVIKPRKRRPQWLRQLKLEATAERAKFLVIDDSPAPKYRVVEPFLPPEVIELGWETPAPEFKFEPEIYLGRTLYYYKVLRRDDQTLHRQMQCTRREGDKTLLGMVVGQVAVDGEPIFS